MNTHPPIRLQIYISDNCHNCIPAHELAAKIAREFPQVVVEVCNLSDPATPRPTAVFATPTYLLDGRVVSLGNPSYKALRARVQDAIAARQL